MSKNSKERLNLLNKYYEQWKQNKKVLYKVNDKLIIKNEGGNVGKLLKLEINVLLTNMST